MKISIITINYNNKAGLEKTIQSVLSQKGLEFEYLVIDGNSSDGSKDVIERYQDRIDFTLIEPDTGIYNAMNKGIRAAKGDYLLFLNSSDTFFEADTLAKADALIDGGYDFYYGNQIYMSGRTNDIEYWIAPEKVSLGFFIDNSLPHQATFIRRSLFDRLGMYNENLRIASDWEFFTVAICLHKATYKHIGIVIADYDFTGISSNPASRDLVQSEKRAVMERYFEISPEDFDLMSEMKLKRVGHLLYIKKFRWPWKLIKGLANILLLFLPKPPKR